MANQLPPSANPVTRGTIDAVICPHCGKPNDMRVMDEQQLLDTGHIYSCDHCHRMMEVVRVQMLKVIAVRQTDGRRPERQAPRGRPLQPGQPQPQQRPAIGIGAKIRGLLGGPKRG